MTQTLLNDINKTIDGIYSLGNSINSDVTKKFHEILNSKSFEKVSDITKKVEQSATDLNIVNSSQQSTIKTADRDTLQTETNKNDNDDNSESFDDIIFEATSEAFIEESLTDEEEELMIDDLIPVNNTIPTTITEEETTMHKELALENPTVTSTLINLQINQTNNNPENNEVQTELENPIIGNNKFINSETKLFDNIKIAFNKENPVSQDEQKGLDDIVDKQIIEDLRVESVSSENSNTGSDLGNLMQNSSPQEQITKMMIQGENYSELKPETTFSISAKPEITAGKILEQVTKQLEGMYNTSKLNIVLNPESLGRVSLQLINSKTGLSAQFVVTNEDVRALLMKGLNELKETLLSHGVNVDNVTIKLNESEMHNEDSQEDWTEQEGSRGGNRQQGSRKQKEEEKPFEQTMFEINNKEV